MRVLKEISTLVSELLRGNSQGQTFGEIDRAATGRAADAAKAPRSAAVASEAEVEETPEFLLALDLVKRKQPFVFVTGKAGTGKTTFIRWLQNRVRGNIAVVAPTGLAALTVGGQTIHSFFRIPPRFMPLGEVRRLTHRAIYEHLDLIVIDEVSMVRADTMDVVDRFMRLNGPNESRPFGGVPVLAVGDLHQLPPVVDDGGLRDFLQEHYRSPYFFSAHSLDQIDPQSVELHKVFRQSDASFLSLLNCIREGRELADTVAQLNDQCVDSDFDSADWVTLVPTRDRAHRINEQRLSELSGPTKESQGAIEGQFLGQQAPGPSPAILDRKLPAPYRLRLRKGARVIFTKNDPAKRWVNGSTGRVTGIESDRIHVAIDDISSGSPVEVQKVKWERIKYTYDRTSHRLEQKVVGSYTQYPLALAWALTIHKAQGQTIARVIVDFDNGTFAAGQAYVALSRCRSIAGLKLRRPIDPTDVKTDDIIRRVYLHLREQDIGARLRALQDKGLR